MCNYSSELFNLLKVKHWHLWSKRAFDPSFLHRIENADLNSCIIEKKESRMYIKVRNELRESAEKDRGTVKFVKLLCCRYH